MLFREDGYLDADFQPLMKKEDDEINRTLYAYIANAMCATLKMLNNGAQLASNLKAASKDNPSDHQRHISKLLRKATRLRPRLDTYDLEEFKKL